MESLGYAVAVLVHTYHSFGIEIYFRKEGSGKIYRDINRSYFDCFSIRIVNRFGQSRFSKMALSGIADN